MRSVCRRVLSRSLKNLNTYCSHKSAAILWHTQILTNLRINLQAWTEVLFMHIYPLWCLKVFHSFVSRTLTSVHNAILDDLCYPAEIVGKRTRVRLDGSHLIKVHLDKTQQTNVEHKVGNLIDSFDAKLLRWLIVRQEKLFVHFSKDGEQERCMKQNT